MTTPSKTWAELAATKAKAAPPAATTPPPASSKEVQLTLPVSKASLSDNWRANTTAAKDDSAASAAASGAGDGWTVHKEDRKTKSNKAGRTGPNTSQNHRSPSSSSSSTKSSSNTKNGNSTLSKVVESVATPSASGSGNGASDSAVSKKTSTTTGSTTTTPSSNWASASAEDELPSPNFAPTVIPTAASNGAGNVPTEAIQSISLPPTSSSLPPPSTPVQTASASLHSSASSSHNHSESTSVTSSSIPTTSISSAASTTSSEIISSTSASIPMTTPTTATSGFPSDSWRNPVVPAFTAEKVLVTAPIPKVNVWSVRKEQLAQAAAAAAVVNAGSGVGAPGKSNAKGGKAGGAPKEDREKKSASISADHPTNPPTSSSKATSSSPSPPLSNLNPLPSSSSSSIPPSNGTKVPASANSAPRRGDGWSGITPTAGSATSGMSGLSSQWPAPEEVVVTGGKKKGKKGAAQAAAAQKELPNGATEGAEKSEKTLVEEDGFEELKGRKKSDKTKWIPIKVDITVARTPATRGAAGSSAAGAGEKKGKGGARREAGVAPTAGGVAMNKSPSNSPAAPLPNGVGAGTKAPGEKKSDGRRNSQNAPTVPVVSSTKSTPILSSTKSPTPLPSSTNRTDFPLPPKPSPSPAPPSSHNRPSKPTNSTTLPTSLQNLDGSYPMKIEAPSIPTGRPVASRLAPEATALGKHAFNDLKSNKGPTTPSAPIVASTATPNSTSSTIVENDNTVPSSVSLLPSTSPSNVPSQPHQQQFPNNPTSHHPASSGYTNSFRNSAPRGVGVRGGALRGRGGGPNRQLVQQHQQQHQQQQQQQMMYPPPNPPFLPSSVAPGYDPNLVPSEVNGIPSYAYGGPGVDPYYAQQNGMGMAPYFVNPATYQPQQQMPVDPYTLDATRYWLLGQLEYYMTVDNLVKDTFLRSKMDDHGWIEISIIASFKRVKTLTLDESLVRETMTLTPIYEVFGNYCRLRQDWPKWLLPGAAPSQINAEFEADQAELARLAVGGLNPVLVEAAAKAKEFLPGAGVGNGNAVVPVLNGEAVAAPMVNGVDEGHKGDGEEVAASTPQVVSA